MRIGIDIDDVLYKTSEMIHSELPDVLVRENLPVKINKNGYYLNDICGIHDMAVIKHLNEKLNWNSAKYINEAAVAALKALYANEHDIEYCIVTWRNEADAAKIAEILRNKYQLDITTRFCLPIGESKADCCAANDIDIMLDDNTDVITSFIQSNTDCTAVLVSPDFVYHNKTFAENYDLVLHTWLEFESMYQHILTRKEKYLHEHA